MFSFFCHGRAYSGKIFTWGQDTVSGKKIGIKFSFCSALANAMSMHLSKQHFSTITLSSTTQEQQQWPTHILSSQKVLLVVLNENSQQYTQAHAYFVYFTCHKTIFLLFPQSIRPLLPLLSTRFIVCCDTYVMCQCVMVWMNRNCEGWGQTSLEVLVLVLYFNETLFDRSSNLFQWMPHSTQLNSTPHDLFF